MRRRYFTVKFKDGSILAVFPRADDPLQFDHKVLQRSVGDVQWTSDE